MNINGYIAEIDRLANKHRELIGIASDALHNENYLVVEAVMREAGDTRGDMFMVNYRLEKEVPDSLEFRVVSAYYERKKRPVQRWERAIFGQLFDAIDTASEEHKFLHEYNDGGRPANLSKERALGDCGIRALAIVTGLSYAAARATLEPHNDGDTMWGTDADAIGKVLIPRGWVHFQTTRHDNPHVWSFAVKRATPSVLFCQRSEYQKHVTCTKDGLLHDIHNCTGWTVTDGYYLPE